MGKSVARVAKPKLVPPLRDGDRMNTSELLRRYEAMPEGFRAELLFGAVYVKSEGVENPTGAKSQPIPIERHSVPQSKIHFRLE